MEIFLSTYFIVIAIASLGLNFLLLQKLGNISKAIFESQVKIDSAVTDIHRSLLDLRDSLEPAKPIQPNKPTNWDSLKKTFKVPVKVDERS